MKVSGALSARAAVSASMPKASGVVFDCVGGMGARRPGAPGSALAAVANIASVPIDSLRSLTSLSRIYARYTLRGMQETINDAA